MPPSKARYDIHYATLMCTYNMCGGLQAYMYKIYMHSNYALYKSLSLYTCKIFSGILVSSRTVRGGGGGGGGQKGGMK